jgi:acyl-CoA dehydrogenase
MSDHQQMLADMANGLFAELGSSATLDGDWDRIAEVALNGLLLKEDKGGFGGSWQDALTVFRLAGYHALALPVAEAAVAAALSGRAQGRGTVAAGIEGEPDTDRFTGTLTGVPWGVGADYIVVSVKGSGSIVINAAGATVEAGINLAGEPRDRVAFIDAPIERAGGDAFALMALARVAQIAGALDAALALSVGYVNERQQFGRALGKFQAVQQSLASFACEAAAANCAAMGAAQAMIRGSAPFEIAAAKLRANRAVGTGTALAHQVHGAIGFTQEYNLHPLTRRLWAWRSEFGGDSHWSAVLGVPVIAAGGDRFWADLTALTG